MTEKQNRLGAFLSDNKLYLIVTFFVLTILGLLCLSYLSIQIQATVRAFVGAESLWSKNQKDAFYFLTRYIQTHSEKDYENYLSDMEVVKGDWDSWTELNQPNPDLKKAYQGMSTGRNHPDDIPLMIKNYLRFHRFPKFMKADEVMKKQGPILQRAFQLSDEIHREISSGKSDPEKMEQRMIELERLNLDGGRLEEEFSSVLGNAARWTKGILFSGILSIGGFLILVGALVSFRWVRQIQTGEKSLKESEKRLRDEKERLNVTLRSIGDGVITTDTQGRVILVNRMAESLIGWTQQEAYERPLSEVFHIINEKTRLQCENPVTEVLAGGENVALANHTVLISKDRKERRIADSGAPIRNKKGDIIGAVLVFRDVTEKQRLEEEQLKSMKLESIGLLAGGIAHDFNNILTAILGNVSLAKFILGKDLPDKKELGPGTALWKRLEETEKASLRAKDLASQLLTFAKGGAPLRRTMPIKEFLEESVNFMLRGANVSAEFYFDPQLREVDIDEGQINQVIHNLVINAIQAMPAGGSIFVRAENVSLNPDEAGQLSISAGDYVKISIKDSGTGISKEVLNKIFDPYFTTKEKGSGLGLSTSYSIIRKHDGGITVSSEAGSGTTFAFYLPSAIDRKV